MFCQKMPYIHSDPILAGRANMAKKTAGQRENPSNPQLRAPSWKSTEAATAVRIFFAMPPKAAARELMQDLCSDDPSDHRCGAELARLVSRRKPGVLAAYADLLGEVAVELLVEEWQARGYVLVAAALNAASPAHRRRLLPLVRARLAEDRIALRAVAIEAFAFLAAQDPDLRDEAMELLEQQRHSAEPAMRARARLMLPVVMRAETPRTR